jgi:hypothetical protein
MCSYAKPACAARWHRLFFQLCTMNVRTGMTINHCLFFANPRRQNSKCAKGNAKDRRQARMSIRYSIIHFVAFVFLSSCAGALKKHDDCVAGNGAACYSLLKKCNRGDREACGYLSAMGPRELERLRLEVRSRGEPGDGSFLRNLANQAPALSEEYQRQNNQNTNELVCIQTGICN